VVERRKHHSQGRTSSVSSASAPVRENLDGRRPRKDGMKILGFPITFGRKFSLIQAPQDSSLLQRRTVVRVPDNLGVPDGMCVASDDTIWVAHWGAGCVCRWDPRTGVLLDQITTGCPHTSSCCLGPAGSLYITTSQLGLDEPSLAAAPLSGRLFQGVR